jgi:hypothetical protein
MEENMYGNFFKLEKRVLDSVEKSDLIKIRDILSSITDSTLVSGVGGSHVVSEYLAKILSKKNNIICSNVESRSLKYMNLNNYKNIISCSYSGNNLGVDLCFDNDLNKYLLSKNEREGVTNINYVVDDVEHSFISLSSTLIPMTILLLYYLNNGTNVIKEILSSKINFNVNNKLIYEILSGYETSSAHKFLESALVESGIGIPIVHDKYDYCHGRSTLNYHHNNNIVFFNTQSELDKLYEIELNKHYESVIKIDKKYDDDIINDYYLTYISMLLTKEIAHIQNKDLSSVNYSSIVKKLYRFKGDV